MTPLQIDCSDADCDSRTHLQDMWKDFAYPPKTAYYTEKLRLSTWIRSLYENRLPIQPFLGVIQKIFV